MATRPGERCPGHPGPGRSDRRLCRTDAIRAHPTDCDIARSAASGQVLACAPLVARGWRNRQTRWIQVPVPARAWGFNSPLAHQQDRPLTCTNGQGPCRVRSPGTILGSTRTPSARSETSARARGAPRRRSKDASAEASFARLPRGVGVCSPGRRSRATGWPCEAMARPAAQHLRPPRPVRDRVSACRGGRGSPAATLCIGWLARKDSRSPGHLPSMALR